MITQFMFKIEPKLKKAAMKKAREKGMSFSAVLNFITKAYVADELKIGLLEKELLPANHPEKRFGGETSKGKTHRQTTR